jgi:hypothetical protein
MTTDNEKTAVPTRCSGAGKVVTDLYEGADRAGRPFCNFLLRCDDGPILRLQLWGVSAQQFGQNFHLNSLKGRRVGFRGTLTGTYDEKPTVTVDLCSLRVGEHE